VIRRSPHFCRAVIRRSPHFRHRPLLLEPPVPEQVYAFWGKRQVGDGRVGEGSFKDSDVVVMVFHLVDYSDVAADDIVMELTAVGALIEGYCIGIAQVHGADAVVVDVDVVSAAGFDAHVYSHDHEVVSNGSPVNRHAFVRRVAEADAPVAVDEHVSFNRDIGASHPYKDGATASAIEPAQPDEGVVCESPSCNVLHVDAGDVVAVEAVVAIGFPLVGEEKAVADFAVVRADFFDDIRRVFRCGVVVPGINGGSAFKASHRDVMKLHVVGFEILHVAVAVDSDAVVSAAEESDIGDECVVSAVNREDAPELVRVAIENHGVAVAGFASDGDVVLLEHDVFRDGVGAVCEKDGCFGSGVFDGVGEFVSVCDADHVARRRGQRRGFGDLLEDSVDVRVLGHKHFFSRMGVEIKGNYSEQCKKNWHAEGLLRIQQVTFSRIPQSQGRTSYCEHVEDAQAFGVDGFLDFPGEWEGMDGDTVVFHADGDVGFAVKDEFDGGGAETACEDAVRGRRRAASLDVPEDAHADFVGGAFFEQFGELMHVALSFAFGDDDDGTGLAVSAAVSESFGDCVEVFDDFRHEHFFGAGSDGDFERDVAGIATHDFDDEEAVVAGGGVADFVNRFHGDIYGGVVADGSVGAVDVVVYGAWRADDVEVGMFLCEAVSAAIGAVAAESDKAFDAAGTQLFSGFGAAFGLEKLLATGGAQKSAAAANGIGNGAGDEGSDFSGDESGKALSHAEDFYVVIDGGADDGAGSGVHAGRVAAGTKDCNRGVFFSHGILPELGEYDTAAGRECTGKEGILWGERRITCKRVVGSVEYGCIYHRPEDEERNAQRCRMTRMKR